MRHTCRNTYAAQWPPLFDLWVPFCRNASQLGISPTHKAMSNFLAVHRGTLTELGVIAKSNKQRVLGHRDFFAPAAFALLIGRDPAHAIEQQRLSLAPRQGSSDEHAH